MTDMNGLFNAISRRDPSKRQIKPVNADQLTLLEELDDDSDSEYLCDAKDSDDSDDDDENSCEDTSSDGSEDSNTESESTDSEDEKSNEETPMDPSVQETSNEVSHALKAESESQEACHVKDSECVTGMGATVPTSAPILKTEKHSLDFMVCTLCLGDHSDPNDELIECDGCGIVVHEDCYKVIDSVFMSSGASSSSTDAWFCEPCLAGVSDPLCELCPNVDGAFKRTDNNRWIHLLCALYTPGVAFNDTENLMDVTLTELPLKAWSQHECSLCDEHFFAWTGVCISCDAGLCRTFFHVTCAQKHGLLSEPVLDEHTIDPYFAHCRQHTDKSVARQRRRNYLTSMSRVKAWRLKNRLKSNGLTSLGSPQSVNSWILDSRVERKLENFRALYLELLKVKEKPYVPTSKIPLYLETSPVAMRLFITKAKALHLPTDLTGQSATSESTRNPSSGYPTFSPDFISYFFEREKKINEVLKHISFLQNSQRELQIADAEASHSYNSVSTELELVNKSRSELYDVCRRILTTFQNLVPEIKASTELEALVSPTQPDIFASSDRVTASTQLQTPKTTLSTTQAYCDSHRHPNMDFVSRNSQSSGRGLAVRRSAGSRIDKERINPDVHMTSDRLQTENVIMSCFVCQGIHEQHLITKCDTCPKAFHLACLDPPLLRMPKRSRLYAWQCSYCTKAVSAQSEVITVDVDAPRQLRRSTGPPIPRADCTSDQRSRNPVPIVDNETPAPTPATITVPDVKPDLVELARVSNTTRGQRSLLTAPRRKAHRARMLGDPTNRPVCTASALNTGMPTVGGGGPKTTARPLKRRQSTASIRSNSQASRLRVAGPGGRRRRSAGNPLDGARFMAAHPGKRSRGRSVMDKPLKSLQFTPSSIGNPKPEGDTNSTTCPKDVQNLSAYDYPQENNSDGNSVSEISSLRTPKVVKYIQIHGHGDVEDRTESVEQIAPLYPQALQRYMICRDTAATAQSDPGSPIVNLAGEMTSGGGLGTPRKSSLERFRVKLKKV